MYNIKDEKIKRAQASDESVKVDADKTKVYLKKSAMLTTLTVLLLFNISVCITLGFALSDSMATIILISIGVFLPSVLGTFFLIERIFNTKI